MLHFHIPCRSPLNENYSFNFLGTQLPHFYPHIFTHGLKHIRQDQCEQAEVGALFPSKWLSRTICKLFWYTGKDRYIKTRLLENYWNPHTVINSTDIHYFKPSWINALCYNCFGESTVLWKWQADKTTLSNSNPLHWSWNLCSFANHIFIYP